MRISWSNVKVKPMDDARVTRALRLLMDHDELANSWSAVQFGKGGIGSIFPPALAAWDLTTEKKGRTGDAEFLGTEA